MVNRICCVLFILLFCRPDYLYSQGVEGAINNDSKTQKSYFIEEGNEGSSLYQHLSWEAIDDILGYEFLLEKYQSEKWIQIDKKTLKKNSINVSLKPGKYRYRVAVINLLNQVEIISEYRNFDVRVAYQPEVLSLSIDSIYFDEPKADYIIVSGKNIFPETVFTLTKDNETPVQCDIIDSDKSGKKITIRLNFSKLKAGTYVLTAKDPSGLYDNSKTINCKFQKPIDIFLSLGYTFSFFVKNETLYKYFKSNIFPLGGSLRFAFMPLKRAYGHFGLGLGLSLMQLKNKPDSYILKAGFILPQVNFVYIFPIIKRRLNFDLHLGGGVASMFQAKFEYSGTDIKSPPYWFWCPSINAGTALQVYLYKKLYIELNLEHTFLFRKDFPKYVIQPSLSLGWEF
ncbi:fibronectin type III domain-containing protein [Treponema denticola]|uniref:fibronectin type III domain-containing protein n=1 Tax=Treponema denticola TaxID=158 RepID=UPI0020A40376|nr:fibronectin type III domain-containing protein [Treponema denticola]UTC83169.1 fibronectin type III domain-containing protein [Treponema denticola]UTY26561.1 fibronectin type III domain-containing protein [Treponema denticola]